MPTPVRLDRSLGPSNNWKPDFVSFTSKLSWPLHSCHAFNCYYRPANLPSWLLSSRITAGQMLKAQKTIDMGWSLMLDKAEIDFIHHITPPPWLADLLLLGLE